MLIGWLKDFYVNFFIFPLFTLPCISVICKYFDIFAICPQRNVLHFNTTKKNFIIYSDCPCFLLYYKDPSLIQTQKQSNTIGSNKVS
ncbi:hypothetical protein L2E82_17873 [Cichorium intybus]|uniref:Uncharacterized protein n=1 Tax=Cichorium intybus TaxID=13427 RepID=A0ACB9F9Z8_CICIN|nr:hypothetical protein L2E82_17873 [Cichorium intybus]